MWKTEFAANRACSVREFSRGPRFDTEFRLTQLSDEHQHAI